MLPAYAHELSSMLLIIEYNPKERNRKKESICLKRKHFGAFGRRLKLASACAMGMVPPVLLSRIQPNENAAGGGARL